MTARSAIVTLPVMISTTMGTATVLTLEGVITLRAVITTTQGEAEFPDGLHEVLVTYQGVELDVAGEIGEWIHPDLYVIGHSAQEWDESSVRDGGTTST